ncbi:MarR family winged helix-turn-helix transcriptional regulator [Ferrimonas marina]|uniref:DNA-binding transcriptional regulator, MarR family n=1 Tax=Ferrimonas marina TaxID=299255 RepID=A0A1M5S201_9GAMM|nr:MarR family transcriptional regulator [Ferrimonas marina]SHH32506.1 DNA-binding transcriptional regulator, MarR family [Ferrimonas marina]
MDKHEQLLISLRKVIRAIDLHSRKLSKESGLTGPQLVVMQKIRQLDGPIARQIASEVNLSPATVTSIVDRLESRGLVTRVRDDADKRRVQLFVSEAGKSLLATAPQPLQEHFIQRYQSLEEWEQSLLLSSVERIAAMMDAEELDAAAMLMVGQMQDSH